jgi:hypothetical protein
MDYQQSRDAFVAACSATLKNVRKVDLRNDTWQCDDVTISIVDVESIMATVGLVWQPGFEVGKVLDGCVFVQPAGEAEWGMAFDLAEGFIYMNEF